MTPTRCVGLRGWALLGAALLAACSESAATNGADAADVVDVVAVDDLAADRGAPDVAMDLGVDGPVRADVPAAMDAGVDVPAAVDAGFDIGFDMGPGVFFGGLFVPVDPHAVPAPGSECAADSDGGVAVGDPSIAPPRPIRPLSVSRVMSQRPSFQWALPEGTTGARVEVCADRCCTRVLQTLDADGTTGRLATALAPGVVFWRMFGRRGTAVGSRASYTWEFGVRHRDTPTDSSWGTIHDFNGDGYDDLIEFVQPLASSVAATTRIAAGAASGLTAPVETGIGFATVPPTGSVGDFNGDGVADFVAIDDTSDVFAYDTSVRTIHGSSMGLHAAMRAYVSSIGSCARLGFAPAATDWNGDGYSDVVSSVLVGCDITSPVSGSFLFIYLGSSLGIANAPQSVLRLDGIFGPCV